MQYIAAPWRGSYVRTVHKMTGCPLCRALKIKDAKRSGILYRGRSAFVILNKFPYQPGHIMIAPVKHTAAFERSPQNVSHEIIDLMRLSVDVLKKAYHPQGFNIGMNLGRSAGAGVVDHYHVHIVPRWSGDSNFMPIVGRTKIVIEDLDATFDRLYPLFPPKKGAKDMTSISRQYLR
jgi:ATP adenylyltransferase